MPYKALEQAKWRKAQSSDGYSPDEAAAILGTEHFSSKKIRRIIRSHDLKARKYFNRWLIAKEDLVKFIAAVEKENN